MANPISRRFVPVNRDIDNDPYNEGQRQDRERRIREDNEIFERTGINPLPRIEHSPLVPINGHSESEDIAGDALDYLEGDVDDFNTPSPDRLMEATQNQERRAFEGRERLVKEREILKQTEEFNKRPKNTILDIEL